MELKTLIEFVDFFRDSFDKKADTFLKEALVNFKRQALHARKLTLSHPTSGEMMSWKVLLPEDMLALLDVLNNYDSC